MDCCYILTTQLNLLHFRTNHGENKGLFPKFAREDNKNFLQHLALDNNYSIGLLYSIYQLCVTICDKLAGILPTENVTRYISITLHGSTRTLWSGILHLM